ncbi:hypothetical protein AB0478_41000 [Streptomyces sp. NPDC051917]|uniref:hypothetical protein n=1 Tax=Streptomyces sp. NPDC051917 TaxID=3154754 RepID=UPI003455C9C2
MAGPEAAGERRGLPGELVQEGTARAMRDLSMRDLCLGEADGRDALTSSPT